MTATTMVEGATSTSVRTRHIEVSISPFSFVCDLATQFSETWSALHPLLPIIPPVDLYILDLHEAFRSVRAKVSDQDQYEVNTQLPAGVETLVCSCLIELVITPVGGNKSTHLLILNLSAFQEKRTKTSTTASIAF